VVDDIATLVNHNVTSVQDGKKYCKREKKDTCNIMVDQCHQQQCHPNIFNAPPPLTQKSKIHSFNLVTPKPQCGSTIV